MEKAWLERSRTQAGELGALKLIGDWGVTALSRAKEGRGAGRVLHDPAMGNGHLTASPLPGQGIAKFS